MVTDFIDGGTLAQVDLFHIFCSFVLLSSFAVVLWCSRWQAVSRHTFTEEEIAYVCYHLLSGLPLFFPSRLSIFPELVYWYVAIEHLHKAQLAHRDLKSPNIMFDTEGRIKISTPPSLLPCPPPPLIGSWLRPVFRHVSGWSHSHGWIPLLDAPWDDPKKVSR